LVTFRTQPGIIEGFSSAFLRVAFQLTRLGGGAFHFSTKVS